VHTALIDDAVPGMGLGNTWVRDVSVVLPTFTAAIDDVTMAFAERLKVGELSVLQLLAELWRIDASAAYD